MPPCVKELSGVTKFRIAYEQWVKRHGALVLSVEESLRGLTIMLPDRFGESEVSSEAIYTFLNLMSLYHSRILGDLGIVDIHVPENAQKAVSVYQNTIHVLRNSQIFIEMVVRTMAGTKARYRTILLIESTK